MHLPPCPPPGPVPSTLPDPPSSIARFSLPLTHLLRAPPHPPPPSLAPLPLSRQEVKRLRDILALHADEVFSLENRKFQLKMSAEERRQEVEVHRWVGQGRK